MFQLFIYYSKNEIDKSEEIKINTYLIFLLNKYTLMNKRFETLTLNNMTYYKLDSAFKEKNFQWNKGRYIWIKYDNKVVLKKEKEKANFLYSDLIISFHLITSIDLSN